MPQLDLAADALTDMALILGVTEKSVDSIARRFNRELNQIVTDAWKGNGAITRDMRALVKQYIEDDYYAGLKKGGVSPDEASVDDAQMIEELDLTQQDYIKAFASDVRAARGDKAAQDSIRERIDLWTTAIELAGVTGLNSAKANEMVVFTGDDGAESCPTCRRLKGSRHRRSWFESKGLVPRDPRFRDNFECGGYRCQHVLEPA